jgi:hypothetical protein
MSQQNAARPRYEWTICYPESEYKGGTVVTGTSSTETLADLFALWTKGHGDLSVWADAMRFGTLVAQYSALTAPVVSVWLGLEPETISKPLAPEEQFVPAEGGLSWDFESPYGRSMQLTRKIDP